MARPESSALEQRVGALRALLKREPDDETAWYGLGRALLDLKRPGEAVDAFRRALAAKPDYTAAQRDLGLSLLAEGESAAAAEAFRAGIALAERTGDLQTGREMAVFLRRSERAAGARSDPPARS
ncbi:MAG TPA: tetratricopeptide repeat protein [Myxococcota bacterium]|nr:tetratricopeptide repeat protein [Myxococcota bacterium]